MKISIIMLWIISVVLAFAIGFFARFTESENTIIFENKDDDWSSVNTTVTNKIDSRSDDIEAEVTKISDNVELDVVSELKRLIGSRRGFTNFASLAESYALVSSLTESEMIEALNELKYGLSSLVGSLPFNIVISRYAELNPRSAVNYVESNVTGTGAKQTATASILAVWSTNDPTSAFDWMMQNTGDENNVSNFSSSMNYFSVFNGLAKQNTDDAFSKLLEISDDRGNILMATAGLGEALTTKDQFIDFYQKSQEMESNEVADGVIRSWVKKAPREAVDWLDSVENGADKTKLQRNILDAWMQAEPNQAADWYLAASSEENRQSYANNIIDRWSFVSPSSALNWINQQHSIDTQASINKLLKKSAFMNTKFATDNLFLLDSDKDKQSVSYRIYSTLKRKNKTKAETFLNTSPYKDYLLSMSRKKKKRSKK